MSYQYPDFNSEEMRHREVKPLIWCHEEEWQSWKTPTPRPTVCTFDQVRTFCRYRPELFTVLFTSCRLHRPAVMPPMRDPLSVSSLCRPLRPRPAGAFSPLRLMLWNHTHLAAGRLAAGMGPSHCREEQGRGLVSSSWPALQLHRALFGAPHTSGVSTGLEAGALSQRKKPVFQNADMGSWPRAEPRVLLLLSLPVPLAAAGLTSPRCQEAGSTSEPLFPI